MAKIELTRQEERIINFLFLYGDINPLEAWTHCGVYRLAAVIHKLRKKGYSIYTERVNVKNRYDEPCSIARYRVDMEK